MAEAAIKTEGATETGTQTQTQATETKTTAQTETKVETGTKATEQAGAKTEQQTKETTAPSWPEGWRTMMATIDGKADDGISKILGRHTDPTSVAKKLLEQERVIAAGKHKETPAFPDKGTDEEKIAWRTENGIPATPQGYLEKMPATLPIQTADKATLDKFIADMHAKNKSPADVADSLAWYYENRQAAVAAQGEADLRAKVTCDDTLRTKWTGTDFRVNKAAIDNLLDQAPPGVKEQFMDGRTADGTPMASHVPTLQWLASVAREINPAATVVPHSSQPLSAIADEIKAIETLMKTDRGAYNKDEGKQARLRQLYSARDAMKQRAGKAA